MTNNPQKKLIQSYLFVDAVIHAYENHSIEYILQVIDALYLLIYQKKACNNYIERLNIKGLSVVD